jgi:hypothetical protein
VEITGGVNNKGSSTNNKIENHNKNPTLSHKGESKAKTEIRPDTTNRSDIIKELTPTTDVFIPNTLKKKRRTTAKNEKAGQLYKSIMNQLAMIRNMQETKEEGQGQGGGEEEPKKAEENDMNNKTVTEKRIASTNQRKRQVQVYEEDEDSVEEDERIPIIRIRGGVRGEAAEEEEDEEDEEDERYVLEDRDETDVILIGGRMGVPKIPGMIRISGCNPNGIKTNQLQCHLQHSKDLQIDIQCYSEVNRNFLRTDVRQFFYEGTKRMERSSRGTWGTSQLPTSSYSDFKPGGTAIISTGKSAGRMKKNGSNKLGRWSYQLPDGQDDKDILIICVYQCCKNPTNPKGMTAYHQQEILLSKMDRTDTEPRRNFYRDLEEFIGKCSTNNSRRLE